MKTLFATVIQNILIMVFTGGGSDPKTYKYGKCYTHGPPSHIQAKMTQEMIVEKIYIYIFLETLWYDRF